MDLDSRAAAVWSLDSASRVAPFFSLDGQSRLDFAQALQSAHQALADPSLMALRDLESRALRIRRVGSTVFQQANTHPSSDERDRLLAAARAAQTLELALDCTLSYLAFLLTLPLPRVVWANPAFGSSPQVAAQVARDTAADCIYHAWHSSTLARGWFLQEQLPPASPSVPDLWD